jgi:hypothetical protein
MSLQLYKPNKYNTGFGFSFSMGVDKNSGEPILFVSAIMQHSWDDKARRGTFLANKEDPEKNITLKFNEFECGSIINAVKNRFSYDTFHKFDDNKTTIKFTPWDKQVKVSKFDASTKTYKEEMQTLPAFGLTIIKNGGSTFKCSLEPGEAECLSNFLQVILSKTYEHRIKKSVEAFAKSKISQESEDCPI